MAGRGTDIVLGGKKEDDDSEWETKHKQVLDAGGLHVIGTERHESRRIDNQLRGRSGRQGDPGYSKFFLSLDDTVLRLFIDENRKKLFSRLSDGMDDSSIEHPMLNGAIANAQRKIEGRNFEIRKQILEYDDVSNDQRLTVYKLRDYFLEENDSEKLIFEYLDNLLEKTADPTKNITDQQQGRSIIIKKKFDHPAFPVDTHIHRLMYRWGLSNGKNVVQTEKDLKRIFPKKIWSKLHLQIIFYGREYCKARDCYGLSCKICTTCYPNRKKPVITKKA